MDTTNPLFLALLANGPQKEGDYTYYLYGGKIRKCKSKRGPKRSRTEQELQSSNCFTEARKMWTVYRRAIGALPIWRIMARETGISKSDSAFHSINSGCFRPGEGVWAFQTFRFSAGSLNAPVISGAERNGWSVTLRWENDRDTPKARASDQVFVGYFYDTLRRSPQLIHNSITCRGDGKITVEIPPVNQPEGTPLHLYLFFGTEEQDRFSPSEYVKL